MDRGGGASALRHQRAELRPLQNLRHQGPESEHHMGGAGGRRRAKLSEYVIAGVTMLPYRSFQWARTCSKWATLAASAPVDHAWLRGHCGPGAVTRGCDPRP